MKRKLHKYTKGFIRLLKEERQYSRFLGYIKATRGTDHPLDKLDAIIREKESSIVQERYLSSLIDICFNWDNKNFEKTRFETLFFKATKVDKDFNYSNNE